MIIGNKYLVLEKIGVGTFGSIYKGENIRTKEKVAIKVESITKNTKLLKNESIIYQYLKECVGIPHVKWFGKDDANYYMVISLLGGSLLAYKSDNKPLSLHSTKTIGVQIILLLKTIHEKGLIHRDIKPDNFLFGLGEKCGQIYIIDFGFCKTYLNAGNHNEMNRCSGLIGSPTYASLNAHQNLEQSRRDDLESLGYMLMFLHLGKLDWQEEANIKVIYHKKLRLGADIPITFANYLNYVKNLAFKETPDYNLLIDMLR